MRTGCIHLRLFGTNESDTPQRRMVVLSLQSGGGALGASQQRGRHRGPEVGV